jgi:hypothetical protein
MAQMLGGSSGQSGGMSSMMESMPMGLGGGMGLFESKQQSQPAQPQANAEQEGMQSFMNALLKMYGKG